MRLRDMLAAAVRPLIYARRIDGGWRCSFDGGRGLDIMVGADGLCVESGYGLKTYLKIRSHGANEAGIVAPVCVREVTTPVGRISVRSNGNLLAVSTGRLPSEGHCLSIRHWNENHPFAWGEPAVDLRIGDLNVRFVSESANRAGYDEWKVRRAAEQAANDSKAAA